MSERDTLPQIKLRRTMNKYSANFKQAAVEKLLQNPGISILQQAKNMGIPDNTLWRWYNEYRTKTLSISCEKASNILSVQELFWVRETMGASERDKIRFCRRNGIPYQKLLGWTELYKDERFQQHSTEVEKMNKRNTDCLDRLKNENRELRKQVTALEKERNSALALLELKKKVDFLMSAMDSEEGLTHRKTSEGSS